MTDQSGIPKQEIPEDFLKIIEAEAERLIPYVPFLNSRGEEIEQRVGQNPYKWNVHKNKQKQFIEGAKFAYGHLHSLPPSPVGEAGDAISFAEWVNDEDCQMTPDGWVRKKEDYKKEYTMSQLYSLFAANRPNPLRAGEARVRWVKASDRLPGKAGKGNSVTIRSSGFGPDRFGHEYRHEFVTTGFKNFDKEHPRFYFLIGNESFLTNENIEWLDEGPSPNPQRAGEE